MNVLVYVDGSEASFRAVDRAIQFGKEGSSIAALHVYPPRLDRDVVSQFEIEPEDLDLKFANQVLGEVSERFDRSGVKVDVRMAEGSLTEVIRQQAEEGDFDLILMGARNESGGRPFDLAEIVRRKSALPVEVVS
jgi:nucleotide-binding universal stress UspA family protein